MGGGYLDVVVLQVVRKSKFKGGMFNMCEDFDLCFIVVEGATSMFMIGVSQGSS